MMTQTETIREFRAQGISIKRTPYEREFRVSFTAGECQRREIDDAEAVAAYESDFQSACETARAMRDGWK